MTNKSKTTYDPNDNDKEFIITSQDNIEYSSANTKGNSTDKK